MGKQHTENVEFCDENWLTIPVNGIIIYLHFQISIFNQKILIQNFIEKNPNKKIKRKGGMLIA